LKDEYTVDVPTVTLSDVGNGKGNQNGAAIKEVAMLLMTSLASKAADSSQVPPQLRQLLNLNVSQLGAQLQAKFNTELGRVSSELTNKLPGSVGQAVQGVLKNPQGALQNPGESLEKGLGGVLSGGGSGAGNVMGRRPATQPAKP
jgi:hypothetical protein